MRCQRLANREARGAKPTLADLPECLPGHGLSQLEVSLSLARMALKLRKAGA